MWESEGSEKQDVTGDIINFKSAVPADYTSLRENVICKVSKCLFFLLLKQWTRVQNREREGM